MYIDGFLLPVPKKNLPAYRTLARKAAKLWIEHGAIEYRECVGDDLDHGHCMPFGKLPIIKKGDVVVFSWILYKSRAHRDRVNKKIMADPRMNAMIPDMNKAPFDFNRMCFGGFKVLVAAQQKG